MVPVERGCGRGGSSGWTVGISKEGVDCPSRVCPDVWTKVEAAHIQVQIKEACCLA